MDVIGTGFGRTGTLSTKHALEHLGFGPCHHMEEAIRHPRQFEHLAAHARGETVDWRRFFAGYGSQVDFPGAVIWRELLETFPDAKVLHTVRDPERWYDSTRSTIYESRTMVAPWARRALRPVDTALSTNDALVWNGLFEGRFEDRARAIEIFESRTAEVVETVPADRLLIFEVADGWEPLCDFLGVPTPTIPFPRVNDTASMRRRFGAVRAITHGAPWAAGALGAGVTLRSLRRRASRRHDS